jgi:hypothetical protein
MTTTTERQSIDRAKVAGAKIVNGTTAIMATIAFLTVAAIAVAVLVHAATDGAAGIFAVIGVILLSKHTTKPKESKTTQNTRVATLAQCIEIQQQQDREWREKLNHTAHSRS